jgi:hypothetical protein
VGQPEVRDFPDAGTRKEMARQIVSATELNLEPRLCRTFVGRI